MTDIAALRVIERQVWRKAVWTVHKGSVRATWKTVTRWQVGIKRPEP